MSGIPFSPDVAPGLGLTSVYQVVASAASPATATFPVPSAGLFLCTVQAKVNNDAQNMAVATFILSYFRGASNVLSRNVIGGPTISSPTTLSVSAMAVNVPTTAGTFTVVASWTDGVPHPVTFDLTMRVLQPLA